MKSISNYIYTVRIQNVHYLQNKIIETNKSFHSPLECSEQVPSIASALSDTTIEGGTSSSTAIPDKYVDS